MAINTSLDSAPCNSLAIAVTCFDSGDNALRLKEISKDWSKLANKVKVFIITNNAANNDIAEFCSEDLGFEVRVIEPNYIGHPYLEHGFTERFFSRNSSRTMSCRTSSTWKMTFSLL